MLVAAFRFLALAAGGLAALASASNNDSLVSQQIDTQPYPYDFPQLGINGSELFPMRLCHGFKLEDADIDEIQNQLASGKLTGVQLLQCFYERIYQVQPYVKLVEPLALPSWSLMLKQHIVLFCSIIPTR